MKKSFLALGLLAAFGVAQAMPTLSVTGGSPVTFSHFAPVASTPGSIALLALTGTLVGGETGTLSLSGGPGIVSFTYLGSAAGDTNRFTFDVAGQFLTKGTGGSSSGQVLTEEVGNGALDFAFKDMWHVSLGSAYNGVNFSRIAFTEVTSGPGLGLYDYFVSFNDFGSGDHDFNDMVVGVSVSPIPEPETYALMLAGLGAMGFVARRRKQA
jgi:hypothetical protein